MERTRTMIFFCVYAEIDMDQKLAFHRGFNAPTQISKYIRGFYSAGSAAIYKIGTQYGPRSCFPYHYNQTTLMAHPVRHLRPRLELSDFCPGNRHPYNVPIILNKTVHLTCLTQYNTISYNGNFGKLLSL